MVRFLQTLISKFLNAFLQAFLNHLVAQIGTTSEQVVAMVNNLEGENLSGEEKAKKLVEQLRLLAISKGKEAPNKLLKLITEVGVTVIKGLK